MTKPVRRVGFFGGPGIGKSKLAARVYSELNNFPFELVDEVIKPMAWRKIAPTGYDQVWLFGKQVHREDVVLRSGGAVITSGPLVQQLIYARKSSIGLEYALSVIAREFEYTYPSLNFMIERTVPYETTGRYQTEQEALFIDKQTVDMMNFRNLKYHLVSVTDLDRIINIITEMVISRD